MFRSNNLRLEQRARLSFGVFVQKNHVKVDIVNDDTVS